MTMKRCAAFVGCMALIVMASWSGADALQPPAGRGGGRGGRGAAPRTRKAVLAWADTRNGIAQHDSVSHALAVMERLGYESGTYDLFIRTDSSVVSMHPTMTDGKPASGGPSLANVDAIFFLGHRDVQLDATQKADLLSFVQRRRKGIRRVAHGDSRRSSRGRNSASCSAAATTGTPGTLRPARS